jgi:hypothetical protein
MRLWAGEDQCKVDVNLPVAEVLCFRDRDRIAYRLWVEIRVSFGPRLRAVHLRIDVIVSEKTSPPNVFRIGRVRTLRAG